MNVARLATQLVSLATQIIAASALLTVCVLHTVDELGGIEPAILVTIIAAVWLVTRIARLLSLAKREDSSDRAIG